MRERLITSYCSVKIDGVGTWKTGDRHLVSASVSLGSNERSSSCTVVLDDLDNHIAAKLIDLTFTSGGIVGLPPEQPSSSGPLTLGPNNGTGDVARSIVAEAQRQGVTAPHKIAFLLAVAEGESSFNHNAYNPEGGQFGQYGGRGLVQITGRDNYAKWGKRLNLDLVKNPSLASRPDVSTTIFVAGIKEGWTGKGGLDTWMPTPESNVSAAYSNIQGGVYRPAYQQSYQKWLRQLPSIQAHNTVNKPTNAQGSSSKSGLPDQPESNETLKGRVITITLGFEANQGISTFEYIHTGTKTDYKGTTTITGQSVRWVMNRAKKNTAFKNITLKELATKVAKTYGLKVDAGAELAQIKLEYVDQSGITDYQLLMRECAWHGFRISESGGTLKIDKPKNTPSGLVLPYRGGDLDTWEIEDKAASQLQVLGDANTNFGQSSPTTVKDEAKHLIDKKTGKLTNVQKEPKRDPLMKPRVGASGSPALPPVSNPQVAPEGRYVTKRVKGLPARFSSPTTPNILRLQPDNAFNTSEHPEALFNRMWTVDTITHNYDKGALNTDISAYAPQDVRVENTSSGANGSTAGISDTGWVNPSPGATSCGPRCEFGNARGRLHKGVDFGGYSTDTVGAAKNGRVIEVNNSNAGGYGRYVLIKHPDGYTTRYAHLASVNVTEGAVVNAGQPIGIRGGSGNGSNNAYEIHLHFEVMNPAGVAIDPRSVLPK